MKIRKLIQQFFRICFTYPCKISPSPHPPHTSHTSHTFNPTPYSLLPTPYSLLPTPYSLLPTPYSLSPRFPVDSGDVLEFPSILAALGYY
ncbi:MULTISPECIES: hypothetical protein [unclassified Moorena]|uniref:hypothetical protein n=1 Tax=unclassified Moorena TaxID=2683338 RepID=UPI001400D8DD|nr:MULTISPECIES: hypothetical protein [unclassified Moorena]NEO11927.1 hypothetical protein [Moorena sp. SIO3E8]NEQ03593.1 hypothetical protein [Moorena sp. SIO3F7]